jgi:hypothetical protein
VVVSRVEQIGVDPLADGIVLRIRDMAEAQRRMGQSTGLPVLGCILESIFFPFFWLTNVIVTYSAFWASLGSEWSSFRLDTREGNHSCPSGGGCKAVFAGSHFEEEGATDDVGGVGIRPGLVTSVTKLKKLT